MPTLTPVKANEREVFMDVLRGFAILGIFLANLNGFSWYNGHSKATGPFLQPGWDDKMNFLHHLFIEGKFYSIFSLLFGWGIALQVKRGISKGIDAIPTIKRRLLFMLVLGAIHLLIWNGDIVFFYALLGFLLLPFRNLSNKMLLITGAVLILSPILLYSLKMTWPILNYPSKLLLEAGIKVDGALLNLKSEDDFMKMMQSGNWLEQLKSNISGIFFRYRYLFFVSRIPKVLGMFLIGYAVGRSDFYSNIHQHKKWVYWIIGVGIAIGLPANYLLAKYMSNHMDEYFQLKQKGFYQTIAYAVGVVPLALSYVGLFMVSFQSIAGKKIMSILAPVGKMAFSNYVLQSFIGNFVFLGAGLGYMGQVGPVCYTLFGIAVFTIQIILSTIWLNYFNYGPIEWLWRSATYKKWQPFRMDQISRN